MQRVGGIISVQIGGEVQNAKGDWTIGYGTSKRSAVVGADRVHGYTEEPQVPFIEGELTDRDTLDVPTLVNLANTTVTVQLANGKVAVLREAFYAGDATSRTKEGNIAVRFEGASLEEVR